MKKLCTSRKRRPTNRRKEIHSEQHHCGAPELSNGTGALWWVQWIFWWKESEAELEAAHVIFLVCTEMYASKLYSAKHRRLHQSLGANQRAPHAMEEAPELQFLERCTCTMHRNGPVVHRSYHERGGLPIGSND
jgi:hypothetical protein